MAKTVTTKYGTKINVDGLTPDQVKKVLSMAQDKGAYGAKGAAFAKQLQKSAATPPAAGAPGTGGNLTTTVQPTTPSYDVAGGTITTEKPTPVDLSGMPKVGGGQDYAQNVYNSTYANYSKDFASNKAQDTEMAKQELANRGIPFDPNPNSLYGRTLAQLETKYSDLDFQAKNNATTAASQALGAFSGADTNAANAFLSGAQLQNQSQQAAYDTDLQAILQLTGQDREAALQKWLANKTAKTNVQIANIQKRPSGGGGAAEDTGPIYGGYPAGVS